MTVRACSVPKAMTCGSLLNSEISHGASRIDIRIGHAHHLGHDQAAQNAKARAAPGAVVLPGAQVLADKGGQGQREAVDGQEAEALDLGIGAAAGHGHGAVEVDGGLHDHVGDGDDGILNSGGDAQREQLTKRPGMKAHLPEPDAIGTGDVGQPPESQHRAGRLRNHRGQGGAVHAHAEAGDEEQVQHHVDHRGHDQVVQGVTAVAHGLEDARRRIVENNEDDPVKNRCGNTGWNWAARFRACPSRRAGGG